MIRETDFLYDRCPYVLYRGWICLDRRSSHLATYLIVSTPLNASQHKKQTGNKHDVSLPTITALETRSGNTGEMGRCGEEL